jgi:serine/threonine protein kinase
MKSVFTKSYRHNHQMDETQGFPVALRGQGLSGSVLKVHRQDTGTVFACKVIDCDPDGQCPSADCEIRAREAIGASPHIVPVQHVHRSRSSCKVFLYFPYFPYDLGHLITNQPLPLSHAVFYLYQILIGLCDIHGAGWVHRDLKPGNIVVSSNHLVAITDLGCADPVSNWAHSDSSGTPCYQAPEVPFDLRVSGPASDMWATGCILFEMLTGRRLFQGGRDRLRQLQSIIDRKGMPTADDCIEFSDVSLLNGVSRKPSHFEAFLEAELPAEAQIAKGMLLRMLQWRPSQRITAVDALKDELFGAMVSPRDLPPLRQAEQCRTNHKASWRRRAICDDVNLPLQRVTPQPIFV